jgi:RimJ/RimL family protein N-acetyltransferase
MKLLFGHSDTVERFVAGLIPRCADGFGPCQAIGVIDNDGKLLAGWVWHGWDPSAETMEFSGASLTPHWMTQDILHKLFAYAFDEVGCQMVLTRNSEGNKRLHRQLARYGFTRWDVPRLFGRRENGVFWTLTDDDWRANNFHPGTKSHEQTQTADAAPPR